MEHDHVTKDELTAALAGSEMRMLERIEQMETRLLKEFRKWALPTQARLKVGEIQVLGLVERVELLEERMNERDN